MEGDLEIPFLDYHLGNLFLSQPEEDAVLTPAAWLLTPENLHAFCLEF